LNFKREIDNKLDYFIIYYGDLFKDGLNAIIRQIHRVKKEQVIKFVQSLLESATIFNSFAESSVEPHFQKLDLDVVLNDKRMLPDLFASILTCLIERSHIDLNLKEYFIK
jgi:hypothetical protein